MRSLPAACTCGREMPASADTVAIRPAFFRNSRREGSIGVEEFMGNERGKAGGEPRDVARPAARKQGFLMNDVRPTCELSSHSGTDGHRLLNSLCDLEHGGYL